MKRPFSLFMIVLLICSCGNKQPAATVHQQIIADAGFTAEDIVVQGQYKRYSGTIAGQPVVLNLAEYTDDMQARYYYEKIGIPISLFKNKDTNTAKNQLIFTEYDSAEPGYKRAKWDVQIKGDSMVGIWSKGDKTYPILLKENYSDDIQRFSIISVVDSIRLIDSLPVPKADFKYQVLLPAGKDEGSLFVQSVILKSMGCDTGNMSNCLKKIKESYTVHYRAATEDMKPDDLLASFNNWDLAIGYSVLYNEHNIVVLDNNVYEYTGGAHGNYVSKYMNIDRESKKHWKLDDIMKVDSAQLIPLLSAEIRKHFDLQNNQPLSSRLFSDDVYVPENFHIGNKGITFSYGLYEIASYADGIVELFIPYNKIMNLLTPEFKHRMNLEAIVAK